MSFTPTEWLALDTNEFIFALRPEPPYLPSYELVFSSVVDLRIYLPQYVLHELHRNVSRREMDEIWRALNSATEFQLGPEVVTSGRIAFWEERGAKKGDAVITAQLEAAGVRYLVSENRHFLAQIRDLPFEVMDAATVLGHLR